MEGTKLTPEELLGPLNDVEAKNSPRELFVQGDRSILANGGRVAIVGSRGASALGIARAQKLAKLLVENGHVVVSGLARGIDTAAHVTAIEHGGKTIAVIGTPLDQSYPKENSGLQAEIARDHLLVTQFAPGSRGGKHNFPMRNRTMALLSAATVIIEAGESSGTISQGWEALRLGRSLFIAKSVVDNPALTWPAQMLGYGAEILSDTTVELLLEAVAERGLGCVDEPIAIL